MFQALGRFEENHQMDLATNEAHERWRASARDTLGRVMKGYNKPWAAPELPEGTINLSDPDSRLMRTQGTSPSHEGRLPRSASLWDTRSMSAGGKRRGAPLERAPRRALAATLVSGAARRRQPPPAP